MIKKSKTYFFIIKYEEVTNMKSRNDFRTVKQVIQDTMKEMNAKDPNWNWKVKVNKGEVRILLLKMDLWSKGIQKMIL